MVFSWVVVDGVLLPVRRTGMAGFDTAAQKKCDFLENSIFLVKKTLEIPSAILIYLRV